MKPGKISFEFIALNLKGYKTESMLAIIEIRGNES